MFINIDIEQVQYKGNKYMKKKNLLDQGGQI